MLPRIALRSFTPQPLFLRTSRAQTIRTFRTTRVRAQEGAVPPPRRPVGAFRGGLFGFLLGTVGAGGATYYYVLEEYRVANELLTEDIYALQAAVQRIEAYVKDVDEQVKRGQK